MKINMNRNIWILCLSLAVATLGYGMVMPIFPFYIQKMGASGDEMGLLIAIGAFTELVFSPLWGAASDRIGRKPALMIGMAGSGLSLVLMGLSTQYWMLLASRSLSGVLTAAITAPSLAYISDCLSEKDRGGGMGILGAAAEIGVTIGPGLGGLLAGDSLSRPFFIGAALSGVTLLLILFLLPESHSLEARGVQAGRLPAERKAMIKLVLASGAGLLFFLILWASFGLANFEAVFGLFALRKFNYGTEQVGMILTVVGLVSTLGKALLTGPTTRRWGDPAVVKASLFAGSLGYIVLLLANTYPTVLLATGFFILTKTLLRPALFSLISKRARVGHGVAMGAANASVSLGRIAGSLWAGRSFDMNINYPYLSGAAILLSGFLLAIFYKPIYSADQPPATEPAAESEMRAQPK
jgi:DHA1 family multidrug resistance protein-like MFS transporter